MADESESTDHSTVRPLKPRREPNPPPKTEEPPNADAPSAVPEDWYGTVRPKVKRAQADRMPAELSPRTTSPAEPDPTGAVPARALSPNVVSADAVAHESTERAAEEKPAIARMVASAPAVVHVPGYELLSELGRGGMGVVYKARHIQLKRLVALKMILSGAHAGTDERQRFRSEAEAIAALQHQCIVQIHDINEHDGRPYFSMEFVDGCTLQQKLKATPQPGRAAAHLVELLAEAVHFAHQRGIVHRDLKPGNILLAATDDDTSRPIDPDAAAVAELFGIPKITDFGLAKRLDDKESSSQTQTGDVLGTPSYMAPEQAAGRIQAIGPATDVYALGAILYDLLTGRPPFRAATTMDTLWQVINEEPIPPSRLRPKLPLDLERICLKCLEKDPARRYATAQALAADLRRHLLGETVHARPAGRLERLWRWSRLNPVPASLLLAVSLGSIFGLWYLSSLSASLVRSAALESAAQQAEMLDDVNAYYSGIVHHLEQADGPLAVNVTANWKDGHGPTMPPPATLTIELGQAITAGKSGVQVRLYSAYPFRNRKDGGPRDAFERAALEKLAENPSQPVSSFEDYQGRPVLRYAAARVMRASCIDCHNAHPDSPKHGWKTGDLRGVLEIIRPLDQDVERVHDGLRGTFILVAIIGVALLAVSGLVLFLSNRRRTVAPRPGH